MKNLKGYVNTKTELELIKLNLESIVKREAKLKKEKEELLKLQKEVEELLEQMEEKLKNLKGIEKELFYEIIVKGTNVTRAVDKVAFAYDMDVSTIWKNYYPIVKQKLIELNYYSSENQVN